MQLFTNANTQLGSLYLSVHATGQSSRSTSEQVSPASSPYRQECRDTKHRSCLPHVPGLGSGLVSTVGVSRSDSTSYQLLKKIDALTYQQGEMAWNTQSHCGRKHAFSYSTNISMLIYVYKTVWFSHSFY